MLKKIMLGIVVLALLAGAENLLAMEKEDNPKEKRMLMQKARRKAAEHAEVVEREVGRHRKGMRQEDQGLQPRQNRPAQQMAGRWLDELTKAYRENDREKMGQLIRKMHQLRQRVRQGRAAAAESGRALRDMPGPAMPPEGRRPRTVEKPRPPTDEDWPRMQPPEDVDVVRPLMPGRGMRGWGQGFQGRGMGGRGQGFRGRGMGQGFPGPWCPNPRCPWMDEPEPEMD